MRTSVEKIQHDVTVRDEQEEQAGPGSPVEEGEESGDEPLLSGSGGVSKECSETELAGWGEVTYCCSLPLCFLLCAAGASKLESRPDTAPPGIEHETSRPILDWGLVV